jgi:carboxymethylenebutenolidase
MAISQEWVKFGSHVGYLAWPEKATLPIPSILVIQEIWGVDGHIEEVTRRFAGAGYAALAIDLYAVEGKRPETHRPERVLEAQRFMNELPPGAWMDLKAREAALAERPAPEAQRIGETLGALFGPLAAGPKWVESLVPAVVAATRYLREDCPQSRGRKVGTVGFCMGGSLSALAACHDPDLAAAVILYGSAPPAEKIPAIRCPVLGLYGALDQRINSGLPAFEEAMKQAGKTLETRIYPGANHAFFNDGRPPYQVDAARDAFLRALTLYAKALG